MVQKPTPPPAGDLRPGHPAWPKALCDVSLSVGGRRHVLGRLRKGKNGGTKRKATIIRASFLGTPLLKELFERVLKGHQEEETQLSGFPFWGKTTLFGTVLKGNQKDHRQFGLFDATKKHQPPIFPGSPKGETPSNWNCHGSDPIRSRNSQWTDSAFRLPKAYFLAALTLNEHIQRAKDLRVDSPFLPTIVLIEHRPFPWVSGGQQERSISLERMGKVALEKTFTGQPKCSSLLDLT